MDAFIAMTARRMLRWLLGWAPVVPLAVCLLAWWAARANTLFGNGRWIVGKDTGKFLFYAHEFMFQPLGGELDLSGYMGFQEILFHRPEDATRRLAAVTCRAAIENGAYLWIEVRKRGQRLLGCRFSRNPRFPSGFYRYDEAGEVTDRASFGEGLPPGHSRGLALRLELTGGRWVASCEGRELGEIADSGPADGHFGFRGSGGSRRRVALRDIAMTLRSAQAGRAREWAEREDFRPHPLRHRALPWALALGMSLVLLRKWRQAVLTDGRPDRAAERFRVVDDGFLLAASVAALGLQAALGRCSPFAVPLALAAAEGATGLTLALGGCPPRPGAGLWWKPLGYGLALAAVAGAALWKHGPWLGRAQHETRAVRQNVQTAALRVRPESRTPSAPFERLDATVSPGSPLFAVGCAYREQVVRLELALPTDSTLDLVLQQQSFRTPGDAEGEELPLHRRLLRLSTRADVPTGLSDRTDSRPEPLTPLGLTLESGVPHRLEVRSAADGMTVVMDGKRTVFPGVRPLGFGETGLLAWETPVTVARFAVEPLAAGTPRRWLLPWAGLGLPLAAVGIVGALALMVGGVPGRHIVTTGLAAAWPLGAYALAMLFLGSETLAALARTRMAWLSLALAASFVGPATMCAACRARGWRAVLAAHTALLLVAAGLALFAWDVLPQEHPLRLRLAGEATVPTGMPAPGATGPWYARNELVGSHTYVWHQRLGGEQVDPRKPAGTVRVFVVGGSQAWGSGAASSRETFAEIVERRLRSRGLPVEVFNAAANGGGIRQALALYRELLRLRAPDIVVADVGLNESAGLQRRRDRAGASIAGLAGSLGDLWAACRADGVDGLLALEPMCGETALRPSAALYDALARESARHGVPVARPGDALYAAEPEHFVWWDTAHLAPYGQRLMADALEPELERLVRERPAITDSGVNR